MAYVKNNWVDREGTTRYFETIDDDGALILTPDYTKVTEMGTPVNADNMNHIEEGIAAGSFTKYNPMATYAKDDLVTAIIDNELKAFRSLVDNNNGNALSDTEKWAEVEFGGGGTSLPLGAPVIMDRILSYEESKGYALQGTYVYKEAIAGSRYGYPDFYNKYVEEKETATPTETTLGDNTVTLYINSNGHRFYDIADKTAIDAWYETYGIADFYGVDTENERIFLPRNKYFMQLTDDTTKVNETVEAGLPNIVGNIYSNTMTNNNVNGAFSLTSTGGVHAGHSGGSYNYNYRDNTVKFDASKSNSIYGNSDTVQPPSSLKLLYYVVGNTTATETLTNVTDITTSENDTLPWGYNFYSGEFLEPALGYAASNGQWLFGEDWESFYNKAVAKIGQSFAGGSILEYTSDYTDYDLVLNQDDMTFRLPLLNGSEDLIGDEQIAIDNFSTLGATFIAPKNGIVIINGSTTASGGAIELTNQSNLQQSKESFNASGWTLHCSIEAKKDDIVEITDLANFTYQSAYFIPAIGNGSLYFKLANALQNQELLDVAKVTEVFSQLTDVAAVIVESYRDGTDSYDIYSNGDIHQWGRTAQITNGNTTDACKIQLLIPMASADYNIQVSGLLPSYEYFYVTAYKQTTTSFYVSLVKGTDSATGQVNWHVWGKMGAV